ncbi:MAG: hypothetical protein ACLUOI_23600 [Eisenbergiella sp.]
MDYFAMDIKSSPENYARTAGVKEWIWVLSGNPWIYPVRADWIMNSGLRWSGSCIPPGFLSIGEWLKGCKAYFLQSYVESEGVICKEFSSYSKEELEEFVMLLKPYIDNVSLRGVD